MHYAPDVIVNILNKRYTTRNILQNCLEMQEIYTKHFETFTFLFAQNPVKQF